MRKRGYYSRAVFREVFFVSAAQRKSRKTRGPQRQTAFFAVCVLRFTERLRFSRAVDSNRKRNTAGIFLLLAGLALFTYGGRRLEPDVVLMKAVTICMECIGIG